MGTNYSFSIGLFDATTMAPNALQLWQNGTLTLDTTSPDALSGVMTIPGFYTQPIPFTGSTVPPDSEAGQTITVAGKSSEVEITVTLVYNYDGFLYNGSYVGGLVSLLDYGAQETYLYIIQGFSPQGPFGANFRGSADSAQMRDSRAA